MNSDDLGNVFFGVVFIYTTVAALIFAIIMFLMIGRSFESLGVLLGIIISLLPFLFFIIAPLIGSIFIVQQTKDLSVGIRAIICSFLPLLLINISVLVPFFFLGGNISPQDLFVSFPFSFLLTLFASLFASLFLLTLFSRIFNFSSVKGVPRQVLEKKCVRCSEVLPPESQFCAFCGSNQPFPTENNN